MDIRKIIIINKKIQNQHTGTPKQLAHKMNLSERTIFNYLNFMKKELKAPIMWDHFNSTYYYEENGSLDFIWNRK